MRPPVGIMQGRLSAPVGDRVQSFPVETWAEEFHRAKEAGLCCIEWIYEAGTDRRNPLGTDEGIEEMSRLARASGVAVQSICADYFMSERLVLASGHAAAAPVAHLRWLIGRGARLGVTYIVVPFVDAASLRTNREREALMHIMRDVAPDAAAAGVELHLETDMPPADLAGILDVIAHSSVRANYDTGNSASLGYDPEEELRTINGRLGSVHVKDRVRGGATVPLGTGSADLPTCFRHFAGIGYDRPFILQVARGATGEEVAWAARNRATVERLAAGAGY